MAPTTSTSNSPKNNYDPEQQPLLPTTSSGPSAAVTASAATMEQSDAEEGPFPPPLKSMLIAEAFGTCLLVQVGGAANCAALYLNAYSNSATYSWLSVGTIWALALTAAIYVSAAQSGGHLNPAVSLSLALVRPSEFRFRKMVPYMITQVLAAFVGGAINLFLFHRAIAQFEKKLRLVRGSPEALASAAAFGNYYSLHPKAVQNEVHAIFIEGFGTAVLVFILFVLTHRRNPVPGAAVPALVGLTYGALVATLGPMTGAALNPARDLGPRLVTVAARWGPIALTDWMPYVVGPLIGGPIGGFVADKVLMLS